MAATPRYGSAIFYGAGSGKTYVVDFYVSDVASAAVTWDSGNGASSTSLTFWRAPERVVLRDVSIATGTADTTNFALCSNGMQIPAGRLRYANHVNTLATRPALSIGFEQGSNISAIQIA